MFRINHTPTFTRTIEIATPEGDGVTTETLDVTFRVLPDDEYGAHDTATAEGIKALLTALVETFDGAVDAATGKPMEFSPTLLAQALEMPHVRMAMIRSYNKAVLDVVVGNSAGSAAPGLRAN